MVVCLCPAVGLFARINTKGWRQGSVSITAANHPFLRHDSHIECGAIFEIDDYVIEQSFNRPNGGILGEISRSVLPAILAAIDSSAKVRDEDKEAISAALNAL